ncbi:MAG: hypothetical protein JJLCMIEE_01800 [Acidimicrobiales bacterium]|nr:hypothetical protein [Acidimicrobiales bacterium]
MGDGIVTPHIVTVVGGDHRSIEVLCDAQQLRVGTPLVVDAVILQLDEEVVPTEDLLQSTGLLESRVEAVVQQALQDVTPEAASGGDHAITVRIEQLPVDARLVVVALEERTAGELNEVAVADVALGEQREMVEELVPRVRVAAGIVDPAPPVGLLEPRVVGHVGLEADDGFDPRLLGFSKEVQDAVHVAVIRYRQSRLTVVLRRGHDFTDSRGAVEHRELRVLMKVHERCRHLAAPSFPGPSRTTAV